MVAHASSDYSINPWNNQRPTVMPEMPDTYQQFAVQSALASDYLSDEEIRAIRPPLQIEQFAPRFGYDTTPLRIQDVSTIDDRYERRDFSGRTSGYSGSSTPSQPLS